MDEITDLQHLRDYMVECSARLGELEFNPNRVIKPHLTWYQEHMAADITYNFLTATASNGQPWKPLKYRQGTPLYLTGAMFYGALQAARESMVYEFRPGVIWTEMEEPKYWRYHQFGTSKIPARPFLNPRPETLEGMADKIRVSSVKFVLGLNEAG